MVWSAFRLVKAAKEAGAKLAIVNVGPTRADNMADVKVSFGNVATVVGDHPLCWQHLVLTQLSVLGLWCMAMYQCITGRG